MTWFAFYILCVCLAFPLMIFGTWWDMKKDPSETITVGNILLGLFLGVCPVVNTLVCVFLLGWIIFDVCPKIVVFGRKS